MIREFEFGCLLANRRQRISSGHTSGQIEYCIDSYPCKRTLYHNSVLYKKDATFIPFPACTKVALPFVKDLAQLVVLDINTTDRQFLEELSL